MTTATYETDFYQWTQQQADLLRQGEFNRVDLDLANIAEEIESMGKRDRRAGNGHDLTGIDGGRVAVADGLNCPRSREQGLTAIPSVGCREQRPMWTSQPEGRIRRACRRIQSAALTCPSLKNCTSMDWAGRRRKPEVRKIRTSVFSFWA